MGGALQVRQGTATPPNPYIITWGPWTLVQSPGWLMGYCLPHPPFVYEFRYAPEAEPD